MGANYSGFVKAADYKQNSDGTFTCTLKTLKDKNPKLPPEDKSIMCIGVLNVNNLKSPNNPDQMLIMSDDNKYIFFPITKLDDEAVKWQIPNLFIISSAVVNYNITIPNSLDYMEVQKSLSDDKYIPNDVTYNNLPDKSPEKWWYRGYLFCQNPPNNLLGINSNKSVWTDIGYMYKVSYDNKFGIIPISPNTFCVKVDSPSVIPTLNDYDCRSIKSTASPIITASGFNFGNNTGMMVGIVVCVLCCLSMCGSSIFVMMRRRK